MWGWVAGAVVLALVLVFVFTRSPSDGTSTATLPPPPAATGSAHDRLERFASGFDRADARGLSPSTTGSGSSQPANPPR